MTMHTTMTEEVYQWKIEDISSNLPLFAGGNFFAVSEKFSLSEHRGDSTWKLTLRNRKKGYTRFYLDIALVNCLLGSKPRKYVLDKKLFHLRVQKNFNQSVVTIEGSPESMIGSANGDTNYLWNDVLQSVSGFIYDVEEFLRGSMIITVMFKSKSASIDKTAATGDSCVKEINKEKPYRMISKLENDEKNSDVKIVSRDGQEFYAYRWILSEGSEVFQAMFRSDMTEKETGVVKLEDLSGATVKLLLHFIYTQKIGQEWSTPGIVEELVYAADKYQIKDLKDFLDANLGKVCSVENAGNLLCLAEKTSMKEAVADILAFFKEQCNDPIGVLEILKNTKIN